MIFSCTVPFSSRISQPWSWWLPIYLGAENTLTIGNMLDIVGHLKKFSRWDVFTDGSCFVSKSKRFSRAASGMYAPGHVKVSIPLPGLDHSSQRAEIAALLLAVKTFRGPIHFFSDCTIAVKGFLILYKGNRLFKLQPAILGQFYWWQEIANFRKERVSVVHISKLAAHDRNPHQDPYFTAGYCG